MDRIDRVGDWTSESDAEDEDALESPRSSLVESDFLASLAMTFDAEGRSGGEGGFNCSSKESMTSVDMFPASS